MQFLSFEKYKEYIQSRPSMNDRPRTTSLFAGSLAGVTAVAVTYPLDTVRARMALQQEGMTKGAYQYRGMLDALIKIPQHEGVVGLYRGMAATVTGAAPYTGLKFCAYETFKISLQGLLGVEEKDLPAYLRVGAGATAGLVALTIVYPFDVIRRRMQTHRGSAAYVWISVHSMPCTVCRARASTVHARQYLAKQQNESVCSRCNGWRTCTTFTAFGPCLEGIRRLSPPSKRSTHRKASRTACQSADHTLYNP